MSSTDAKVEQMFQILLDPQEKGTEKKQKVETWVSGAELPNAAQPSLCVCDGPGALAGLVC